MAAPLYRQVHDKLLARIAGGALAPGVMLPSEAELGVELGVSAGTARKALIELERRGIVRRRQGKGTFVAVRTEESALFHFFRLRGPDGEQVIPCMEDERVIRRPATGDERAALHGAPDTVFEIARLRSIDGAPRMREILTVPVALFPGLDERAPLPNALYALYQSAYGCAIVTAAEKLGAVACPAADAALLGLPPGAPVLEVHRLATDIAGRVVEIRRSLYATVGLTYDVTLS